MTFEKIIKSARTAIFILAVIAVVIVATIAAVRMILQIRSRLDTFGI